MRIGPLGASSSARTVRGTFDSTNAMPAASVSDRTFDAAIFDLDGLLIDSERAILRAWVDAAAQLALPLRDEDFRVVIGLGFRPARSHLTQVLGGEDAFARVREVARATLAADRVFVAKAGAREILDDLTVRGVPRAVASSTARDEVVRRLCAVGFDGDIAAVAGGDEVAEGKPDPAVYRLAAERLGVRPERCLAFEDSEHGARAALAAGMQVVIVPDLVATSAPVAAQALAVLDSLNHARVLVPRWFPKARAA